MARAPSLVRDQVQRARDLLIASRAVTADEARIPGRFMITGADLLPHVPGAGGTLVEGAGPSRAAVFCRRTRSRSLIVVFARLLLCRVAEPARARAPSPAGSPGCEIASRPRRTRRAPAQPGCLPRLQEQDRMQPGAGGRGSVPRPPPAAYSQPIARAARTEGMASSLPKGHGSSGGGHLNSMSGDTTIRSISSRNSSSSGASSRATTSIPL